MAELTQDDVIEVLGPVGDVVTAEIIATGISREELVAARDRVVRDRKGHDPGPPLEPGPVAEVVDILERRNGLLGESGSTFT
jgi:uncharacterized Fe-S cluster-containing radical SAM superfamily enzyme